MDSAIQSFGYSVLSSTDSKYIAWSLSMMFYTSGYGC